MKKNRAKLAARAQITVQWLSDITHGRGRPSWELAKTLAEITNSAPDIWMEGNIGAMQQAIVQYLYTAEGDAHETYQDPQ